MPLTFERTDNLELVREILTHPVVWPHVGDDFAPPREAWQPNPDRRIWYVLVREDEPAGVLTFLPRSTVLWEVHIGLLPRRQVHGRAILSGALRWMFTHSTAERIIGEIPACNRLAIYLAAAVMVPYGCNPRSFKKHGRLEDLVLFGIDKE